MATYDVNIVRASAQGHWLDILGQLGPASLAPAIERPGRHVPCPKNGGSDGFRLFADANDTGGGVSNREGSFANGFLLLSWLNGWTFAESVNRTGAFLGCPAREPAKAEEKPSEAPSRKTISGTVAETAVRPFCNKKGNHPSYCLTLETDDGRRVHLWGDGVRNAVRRAHAEAGDEVIVVRTVLPGEAEITNWEVFMKEDVLSRESVEKLWENARAFSWADTEAVALTLYLRARELGDLSDEAVRATDSFRFAPSVSYYDGETRTSSSRHYPALISAVRDPAGRIVTLHRTYLDPEKGAKAPVDKPKKLMKLPAGETMSGAAIRIGEPADGLLGVAEGIETALSVWLATGLPCWSLVSASNLRVFTPPEGVKTVVIWADLDKSGTGEKCAAELRNRITSLGIRTVVAVPPAALPSEGKGTDWNDVLRVAGTRGFPPPELLKHAF